MTTPTTTKKNGEAAHVEPEQPTIRDLYVIAAMIGSMASGDMKPLPLMQEAGAMDLFADEVNALADVMMARRVKP